MQDTAGQERFSSLSTAFFRGADAALLMFDVNAPETMLAMKKWWADFCERAPLSNDADMNDYCCVVVGNKIDLVGKGGSGEGVVSESEALQFLDELMPPSDARTPIDINILPPNVSHGSPLLSSDNSLSTSQHTVMPPSILSTASSYLFPSQNSLSGNSNTRSPSIAIAPNLSHRAEAGASHSPKHQLTKSRSRSSSRFYSGTMTTTHTTLTIYHTPSSSLFDMYHSARSSPEPWSASSTSSELDTISPTGSIRQRSMTMLSTNSASSGSGATITPSLFARENGAAAATSAGSTTPSVSPLIPSSSISLAPPLPPDQGPKLFFTSAKTGEGVADVFEYIAQRVVRRWEYEEWVDARTMHFREASGTDTVRLNNDDKKKPWSTAQCCSG